MIDADYRTPSGCTMTVVTQIIGADVIGILAGGGRAIVATDAVGGIAMVKVGRRPGIGGVAVIAAVATGDVPGMFARGDGSVMTGGTCAGHAGMVKPGWTPGA